MSTIEASISAAGNTQMLTGCLDELGLESAHVVGHSRGAMMWLALDASERVRSLVAIGTPAVALGARLDGIIRVLARPALGRLMLSMPKPTPPTAPSWRALSAPMRSRLCVQS